MLNRLKLFRDMSYLNISGLLPVFKKWSIHMIEDHPVIMLNPAPVLSRIVALSSKALCWPITYMPTFLVDYFEG